MSAFKKQTILSSMTFVVAISLVACNSSSFSSNRNVKNSGASSATTPESGTSDATPDDSINPTTSSTSTSPTSTFSTPPVTAVTQGSFTVWAEPNPPAAFQDYQIIIQVTLPSNASGYDKNDLSGNLVGTDFYTQGIASNAIPTHNFNQQETMQISGNTARLAVWVPGACGGVNDTINISSAILNESQAIKITFENNGSPFSYGNCGNGGPPYTH